MILITQIYLHALNLNENISLCFQRKDRHVERFGSQTRPNFQAAHNNCIIFAKCILNYIWLNTLRKIRNTYTSAILFVIFR